MHDSCEKCQARVQEAEVLSMFSCCSVNTQWEGLAHYPLAYALFVSTSTATLLTNWSRIGIASPPWWCSNFEF